MKFKSLAHLLGGLYLASNAAIAAARDFRRREFVVLS